MTVRGMGRRDRGVKGQPTDGQIGRGDYAIGAKRIFGSPTFFHSLHPPQALRSSLSTKDFSSIFSAWHPKLAGDFLRGMRDEGKK